MIYLIGGPPRCGKTTLAKKMSKKLGIPWLSCDTLESIAHLYVHPKQWPKKCPYTYLRRKNGQRDNDHFYSTYTPAQIIKALNTEAEVVYDAIDVMIACEIDNGNNYIIEGCQLLPSFVKRLIKKYGQKNIRAVFLTKYDEQKFAQDVRRSTTPNDWLLVLTKKAETFVKVGKMVSQYSRYFETEAKKVGLRVFNADTQFIKRLNQAIKYLAD